VSQACVDADASRRELEPRERVQGDRIRVERAHVDDHQARKWDSHRREGPSGGPKLIGAATDESDDARRSYTQERTERTN
jgi:hypothetical protein